MQYDEQLSAAGEYVESKPDKGAGSQKSSQGEEEGKSEVGGSQTMLYLLKSGGMKQMYDQSTTTLEENVD